MKPKSYTVYHTAFPRNCKKINNDYVHQETGPRTYKLGNRLVVAQTNDSNIKYSTNRQNLKI